MTREIYLNDNRLNGGIPASIGNLTGLAKLNLNSNLLNESIPSAIKSITALTCVRMRAWLNCSSWST